MKLTQLVPDDDAVSPVIGVILMVAITVILAAVIGTFVLDLGSNVQANPTAGVTYDADTNTVTLNSLGPNTDEVYCSGDSTQDATSVGETFDCSSGENVIAVTSSGNEAVIRELE